MRVLSVKYNMYTFSCGNPRPTVRHSIVDNTLLLGFRTYCLPGWLPAYYVLIAQMLVKGKVDRIRHMIKVAEIPARSSNDQHLLTYLRLKSNLSSASKMVKEFLAVLPAVEKQPRTSYGGSSLHSSIVRDQLTTGTWISLGAVVQGLAFMSLGRLSLIPALLVVLLGALDRFAILAGLKHNHFLDKVIMQKFSAQFPNEEGHYGNQPSAKDVVVFIIGTRTNHPLGVLAPGTSTIFAYFKGMEQDLRAHADQFGFLGMRTCLDASERGTGSEVVSVCYFRTVVRSNLVCRMDVH
jgi:hypothetical protein